MNKNKVIKIVTVVSFGFLLIAFVAFKSGAFDQLLQPKKEPKLTLHPVPAPDLKAAADTTPATKPDSLPLFSPTLLPTSKSLIIVDQKMKFPKKDSLKKKKLKFTPKQTN